MYKVRLLLLALLAITTSSWADTTYVAGGDVSGMWTSQHSPYFVQGNIHVPAGDSLHIDAGVMVRFDGPFSLTVGGCLQVTGEPASQVLITAPQSWRGIEFWATGDVQKIDHAIIEHAGQSDIDQAALKCLTCELLVTNTTIRNGIPQGGRALYASNDAYARFDSCEIYDNVLGCGCGGVAYLGGRSYAEFRHCTMLRDSAEDGGVFCLYGSDLSLKNCVIDDNAGGIWGGVFYAEGFDASVNIEATDCIFRHNRSMTSGVYYGWASDDSTSVSVRGCQFIENRADPSAGNTSVFQPVAMLEIDRCTFAGNGPGMGGAIRSNQATDIRNSIFVNTQGGAAVVKGGGSLTVEYCDFDSNAVGDVLGLPPGGFGNVDTLNANGDSCDVFGNIFLGPQFVNQPVGDYHLMGNSPCIDAGDPNSERDPDGTVADIGALYFEQQTQVPSGHHVAQDYRLEQNYPNPFNAITTISFDLPRAGEVLLSVFDITGRRVVTLMNDKLAAGTHEVRLDAEALPSGIYVYRLQAEGFSQSRKLVVLK